MSYQFWAPPNEKISCLLSLEKISCPKRKSHVFSVLGPPQRENLLSFASWENLMTQEKISCIFSFGPHPHEKISCLLSHEKISCPKRKSHVIQFWVTHPTRKSPVSCLMRKSHVSRENLMSYQFGVPPQWENLLSLVSWENLMSQEKISFLISLGPPSQWENLLSLISGENITSQEKISCLFILGSPQRENLLSPVSWEIIIYQERILCLFSFGSPQQENLLAPVSWENLMSQEKISHTSCFLKHTSMSANIIPPVS